MAAISKAWVTQADAAVDPDSPVDATLMTGFRDNLIHLREWLGNAFTAGAVQDHNHDGANSALVPVGPNLLRNGSFEDGESGWTFTDFTGGSHAISTSNHRHGAKSATITSTVLANGGGDALNNEYMLFGEVDNLALKFWIWASVANVSSKLEVTWYDNAKASISTTVVQNYTNTPTTPTHHKTNVAAPTNTRFFKIRITGGVPSSGSSTGTITFDGIEAFGAIVSGLIKTTFGDNVTSLVAIQLQTLAGGTFGFYPQLFGSTAGETSRWGEGSGGVSSAAEHLGTTPTTRIKFSAASGGGTAAFVRQYYIQASPPYNLGDGDVPLFVFAVVDGLGNVESSYVAPEPPWANNGPTNIRPEFFDARGRGFRRRRALRFTWQEVKDDPAKRDQFLSQFDADATDAYEITQAVKHADMPLIPHPFQGNDLTGKTIVLLDPVSSMCERLLRMHEEFGSATESIGNLLHGGYLRVGNTPLNRTGPPGVMPVAASWKLTA